MEGILELEVLLGRYDKKKVRRLVEQSHDYQRIKNIVNIIREGNPKKTETLDQIGIEEYGKEEWEQKSPEVKEALEGSGKKIDEPEFVTEIISAIRESFIRKNTKGRLDDVIDSYVRAIIKNKAITIFRKDQLLRNFIAKASKTFPIARTKFDLEDEEKEGDLIAAIIDTEKVEEVILKRRREQIIRRNILRLNDNDQKIVGLLTIRGLDPKDIADIWPTPITNTAIQQIKEATEISLAELLVNDPQYAELFD
jgi:hypothetical protein